MLHMVRGPEEGSPNTHPTLGLLQDLLVTDLRVPLPEILIPMSVEGSHLEAPQRYS